MVLVGFFVFLYFFPESEINPFPPMTTDDGGLPVLVTPTMANTLVPVGSVEPSLTPTEEPIATFTMVAATETIAPTSTFVPPTLTATMPPTETLAPTATEELAVETALPSPTASYFLYIPQTGSPVPLDASIFILNWDVIQ